MIGPCMPSLIYYFFAQFRSKHLNTLIEYIAIYLTDKNVVNCNGSS